MWECGAASGVDKIRGIIPVVIGLGRGDLANSLEGMFRNGSTSVPEKRCLV
jgi:hypothetical protein